MSVLYRAQTNKGLHLTSVEADTYQEARKKVWHWAANLPPDALAWLRIHDFIMVPDRGGLHGKNMGI